MTPVDPFEPDKPLPPAPPLSIPPLPPTRELLVPGAAPTHVPLTPMMDFLQRRLEGLERDLDRERERARTAEGLIKQQEALRGEVESQLKLLTENLRREKSEREGEEEKSRARGRIDSLEKRLDEMHQSWVSLLKDAVLQREQGAKALTDSQASVARAVTDSQAALAQAVTASQSTLAKEQAILAQEQAFLRQELATLGGSLNKLLEAVGAWRAESQGLAQVLPELRRLADQVPADGRRLGGELATALSQFAAEVRERLASWEHRQALEAERAEERVQNLVRERSDLVKAWEEKDHAIRQELLKERIQRETESAERLAQLHQRLDETRQAVEKQSRQNDELKDGLARALEVMASSPQAKDQMVATLEAEKRELLKALQERSQSLQRYIDERREVEKTLGESLLALHRELDSERQNQRAMSARLPELEIESAKLKDLLASAQRSSSDKDERHAALSAERDQLAQALLAEAAKVRDQIQARLQSEEGLTLQINESAKRLAEEMDLRVKEATLAGELRAQLATLSEHLAKSLQEKDATAARYGAWESERQKLLGVLKEKEDMISMLNATFQRMLQKE